MATDERPESTTSASLNEETTETPRITEHLSSWSSPEVDQRGVKIVAGARASLEAETEALLRGRLKFASLVILVTDVFYDSLILFGINVQGFPPGRVLMAYKAFVIVALIAVTGMLWSRVNLVLRELRAVELLIFGLIGVMFVLMQTELLQWAADPAFPARPEYAALVCTVMWFMLTAIYGAFIPNTLRRAVAVLGTMSLAPIALVNLMAVTSPAFGKMLFSAGGVPEMVGSMAVAFTTAVYGSYKIGALRQEAFEARQLGQYRLKRRLGSGGMGEVYLAEHYMIKRPCAVKVIRPSRAADAKTLARFEREVHAVARLTHLNTIEIFDYGRAEDGTFYYAMEYLPGLNLQEIVERQGPLQPARAVHLLRQVCNALSEAHAKGLIHRDIKPSNIIAAERGGVRDVAKLLDFGLATSDEEQEDLRLTQEGAIAGSPFYLAPERFLESGEPDARSDVYSLGGVAYFLLTGRPPFMADKPIKVMIAHAQEELRPPRMINSAIPLDLERIVVRCLAKSADDRYDTVAEIQRALAACECADEWSQDLASKWWTSRAQVEDAAGPSDTHRDGDHETNASTSATPNS